VKEKEMMAIMASDVLIFESGNVESSLAEYESHHMQSDIAFIALIGEVLERLILKP
jgi:hypothetical protein